MFEIGLSTEQYGDYEQGTGNSAYENESARLIDIAKNNGRFITKSQIESFGDRKRLPSGESVVYFDEKNSCVYKVRNPFAKSHLKRLHPMMLSMNILSIIYYFQILDIRWLV